MKESGAVGLAWEKIFFLLYSLSRNAWYVDVLPWGCFTRVTYTIK